MFRGTSIFYPWDSWYPQPDLAIPSYFVFSQNMPMYLESTLVAQVAEHIEADATHQADEEEGVLMEIGVPSAGPAIEGVRVKAAPPLPSLASFGTKKGYMAKMIALCVALDLGLTEKINRIRTILSKSRAFQILFDSHLRMMTDTGHDDRFDYS